MYLKYDQTTDFVIDFDNVWEFIGFTRKNNATRLLKTYFKENIDYIINNEKAAPPNGGAAFQANKNIGGGGLNKNIIMLNVRAFKKLNNTSKSDQIHDLNCVNCLCF